MTGGIFAPAIAKGFEEVVVKGTEHSAEYWAGRYYHYKYPKWFRAFGKYSGKFVPQLASKIKLVAKGASIIGWAIFDYKIFDCIKKCEKCL